MLCGARMRRCRAQVLRPSCGDDAQHSGGRFSSCSPPPCASRGGTCSCGLTRVAQTYVDQLMAAGDNLAIAIQEKSAVQTYTATCISITVVNFLVSRKAMGAGGLECYDDPALRTDPDRTPPWPTTFTKGQTRPSPARSRPQRLPSSGSGLAQPQARRRRGKGPGRGGIGADRGPPDIPGCCWGGETRRPRSIARPRRA